MGQLLSTAAPLLVAAMPWTVLAQNAVNTARVASSAGTFEANTANNEATDSDALLAVVAANADTAGPLNGANGGANVINVLANDRLNGAVPTPATVTLTVTAPSSHVGVTLDVASGNVSVAPGVPASTYTIGYQICETANPANCSTATVSVVIAAPAIAATADTSPAINGASGDNDVLNIFANDTLNGVALVPSAVTATITSPATSIGGGPVPVLDPATGLVDVPAGTPAGSYVIGYRICENNNPSNCANANATIIVGAAAIAAAADPIGPVNGLVGSVNAGNVLANDVLNGVAATTANVIISVTTPSSNAGVRLDPVTGIVGVAANVPAATYTIAYQICEKLNPANCATATVSVVVAAPAIAAVGDTPAPVNGANGGNDIINAFANDTLNGAPLVLSAITATIVTAATPVNGGPVPVLDVATGLVDVPAATPAGTYTIAYKICEKLNSTNCASASVTVVVQAALIEASADTIVGVREGLGSANAGNVLINDKLNGIAVTPASVLLTVTSPASNPGIRIDTATGIVSVSPEVPEGTYTIGYQICEKLNPSNCKQAVVTITVDPALSALSGTVYDDRNGNQTLDPGEARRVGWIIEVLLGGQVVGSASTDAQGNYKVEGLRSGPGYSIRFTNPENSVVYRIISNVTLGKNTTVVDQNLPLDPSGVIYNSLTRSPIRNVLVTLNGANGAPLPGICFISPSQQSQTTDSTGAYRFDIVSGAAPQCPTGETVYTIIVNPPQGFSGPSTVLPAEGAVFDPTGFAAPVKIGPTSTAPQGDEVVRWFPSFRLAAGDPDVIFNHIPLDPFLTRAPLVVTKTSIRRTASVGDLIPYTITVRNAESFTRAGFDVVDILPPGFKYVTGTSSVNGVASEPVADDRKLRWTRQRLAANATLTFKLTAVVGSGVTSGDRVNNGVAESGTDGAEISNRGQAVVSIVPSAIFDCAEVIGKVYDDLDGDGYQDEGETGVAGARLATVNGELITTDAFGRYHIACAAVPDAQIGSNFVLKLDVRTIAQGYAPTTDNPQSIRLTRGKISELNFGVQKAETVALDIDTRAFVPGTADLRPDYARRLAGLRPAEAARLIIQINYQAQSDEDWELAERRVAALKAAAAGLFERGWDAAKPVIEANIGRAFGAAGRE